MSAIWVMQSFLSLPLLPGLLLPSVVAPYLVLSAGKIELFDIQSVRTNDLCLNELFEIELFDHWNCV